MAITWQSMVGPNFSESNRLAQQGANQLITSISNLGGLANQRAEELKQANTGALAALINQASSPDQLANFDLGNLQQQYGANAFDSNALSTLMGQRTDRLEDIEYKTERDEIADTQWQTQQDYQAGRAKVADKQWQLEFDKRNQQEKERVASAERIAKAKLQAEKSKLALEKAKEDRAFLTKTGLAALPPLQQARDLIFKEDTKDLNFESEYTVGDSDIGSLESIISKTASKLSHVDTDGRSYGNERTMFRDSFTEELMEQAEWIDKQLAKSKSNLGSDVRNKMISIMLQQLEPSIYTEDNETRVHIPIGYIKDQYKRLLPLFKKNMAIKQQYDPIKLAYDADKIALDKYTVALQNAIHFGTKIPSVPLSYYEREEEAKKAKDKLTNTKQEN